MKPLAMILSEAGLLLSDGSLPSPALLQMLLDALVNDLHEHLATMRRLMVVLVLATIAFFHPDGMCSFYYMLTMSG